MKFNPDIHHRRSIRLKDYDYSQSGAYFVTICTRDRECLFGEVVGGEMRANVSGKMIQRVWNELPQRFLNFQLDQFILMPNHLHGNFVLNDDNSCRGESCIRPPIVGNSSSMEPQMKGDHKDRPYGTLPKTVGRIVQAFKSITTHQYILGVKKNGWKIFSGKLWQGNYHEHVIRNDDELNRIRQYIQNNPLQWALDENNPINFKNNLPFVGATGGSPSREVSS